VCGCVLRRIGEDVSEKLDYIRGVFTVERRTGGKWSYAHCRTLLQAPVPAEIIDKGIPTSGLLAPLLGAKYADHLPLYRQARHLRSCRPEAPTLDAGSLARYVRSAAAAASRRAQGACSAMRRWACR
jgi:transposase